MQPGMRTELAQGWPRLLTAFTGVALGVTAIFFYTQGIFIRPLQAEFGWSRGEASAGPMFFGLALAVSSPLCGLAVDRFGVRLVASMSIFALSGCFWALSRMQGELALFLALSALASLVASGTSAVPYLRLVGGWFLRARGLAIGLTMVGSGLASALVPPFVTGFIAENGWRAAYQALGLLALAPLPLVLLFGRESRRTSATESAPSAPAAGMTFKEACATRQLWTMGLTFTLAGCAVAGLIPHLPPLVQDAGFTPVQVGAVMSVMGLSIMAGRALTGLLLDRVFAPLIAIVVLAATAFGCLGLAVYGAGFAFVGAALIGLAMGSEIDLAGYMAGRYFGLKSYGAIFGFQYGLFSLGAALGPLLAGLLYDKFGNYDAALFSAAGVLVVGIPLVLSLGAYPTKEL